MTIDKMTIDKICEGIIIVQGTWQRVLIQQHTYQTDKESDEKLCCMHKKIFDKYRRNGFYGNSKLCTLYRITGEDNGKNKNNQ